MKENSDKKRSIKKVPGKKIVPKPPKFNIMWIYAAIVLAILGVQFFAGMNNARLITYQKFERDMLKPGDVEKLVGYRQDDLYNVEVYIKKDSLEAKDKYKDVRDSGNFGVGGGPQYVFKDGSFEALEKRLDKSQENLPEEQRITVQPETRNNPISGWFWTVIFPIILFALLWIFLMRRMGAGGAGGAGGQIFSSGKSKAQLFDKESQVTIA